MARSAEIAELNLHTARIPEQPSVILPGTVDKIIASPRPNQAEKAQIAVHGTDRGHRDLRIENTLTDEHGDDVSLKKAPTFGDALGLYIVVPGAVAELLLILWLLVIGVNVSKWEAKQATWRVSRA